MLRESQPNPKKSRKRVSHKSDTEPEPKVYNLGEKLREISRELSLVSYLLPDTAHSWGLVNSLQNILAEAKSAAESNSYIETSQLSEMTTNGNKDTVVAPARSAFKRHISQQPREDNSEKEQNNSELTQATASVIHSLDDINVPLSSKIQRTDYLHIRPVGLDNVVDQIARSQQSLLSAEQTNLQHSYMSANSHLLTHNLITHHHTEPSRQVNLMHSVSSHSLTSTSGGVHSLINMAQPSNMSLQMTSILPDNYQLPSTNVTSNMYGQLQHPQQQRRYIELQPVDNNQQVLLQRLVKSTTE